MSTHPLLLAEDRGLKIPPGARVLTDYVPVHRVRLGCRDRMAVGDVERAYNRRLQLAPSQPWPPPIGVWDGEWFVIEDGRHEYVAALMLGFEAVLVAWVINPGDTRDAGDEVQLAERSAPDAAMYAGGSAAFAVAHAHAPWFDFSGGLIWEGDTLSHPTGERGTVLFDASKSTPAEQWRVDYGNGLSAPLVFQIGKKGQAVCLRS